MDQLSTTFAFAAGLVSFLSPCILPLIPGFLGYLAGSSVKEEAKRREIFFVSIFFVLGFSAVFSVLGVVLNTIFEAVAYDVQIWLGRIGGAFIIFFGLYLAGLIRVQFLEKEYKVRANIKFSSRYITSFVFGAAFAAGWTPCVGAVLGAILGLATTSPGIAFTLLLSYSFGLGLPFLVVGLFTSQASSLINRYGHILKYINISFGAVLIIIGILVFTRNLNLIANLEIINKWLLVQ